MHTIVANLLKYILLVARVSDVHEKQMKLYLVTYNEFLAEHFWSCKWMIKFDSIEKLSVAWRSHSPNFNEIGRKEIMPLYLMRQTCVPYSTHMFRNVWREITCLFHNFGNELIFFSTLYDEYDYLFTLWSNLIHRFAEVTDSLREQNEAGSCITVIQTSHLIRLHRYPQISVILNL